MAGFFSAWKKTDYSRKERGKPAVEGFYPGFLFTIPWWFGTSILMILGWDICLRNLMGRPTSVLLKTVDNMARDYNFKVINLGPKLDELWWRIFSEGLVITDQNFRNLDPILALGVNSCRNWQWQCALHYKTKTTIWIEPGSTVQLYSDSWTVH